MWFLIPFIKATFKGIFLSTFVSLFLYNGSVFCQHQLKDQGVGKMVLKWYLSHIDHQEKKELYYKYTYYMKNNLVLRREINNDSSLVTREKSEGNSLTVSKNMPTYLINLSQGRVRYTSETDSSKFEVALADYDPELFYKCSVAPPKITQLDTLSNQTMTVAGLPCIKGKAHILNSDFEFAYTKSQLNIESPLNLFVPNFPYQILWIKIPLDNNPQGIQTFVIDSISETIPENIKNSIIW